MAYIFSSLVGFPKVVSDPNCSPLSFAMGGWSTSFAGTHCALQGVSGSTAGNYQFLLTLRNFTYVYVFGEKMGEFIVTGLAYPGDCTPYAGHGLTYAIAYYNTYAISVTGTPVALLLAGWATWAFLVEARFTATNPRSVIGQFQFRFRTIAQ